MKLSWQKGEPHEEFCIKRKCKEGRKIREGNLNESDRVKDGELISVDNMFNWMQCLSRPSVMIYRKMNSLLINISEDHLWHIELLLQCKEYSKLCMKNEILHRKGVILAHTLWMRAASITNIITGTRLHNRFEKRAHLLELTYKTFYTNLHTLMEKDRALSYGELELKTYPACRVVFQEERDGGELRKIGPFWSLVEDYENIWETYETELSKMKPFVIEIEEWDAVKEWRMNKDPSDLLTISSLI